MAPYIQVEREGRGGPPHLSYSRVSKYLLCPEQYRLYYVEGLRPETPSASLVFGQAVHQALAAFFTDGLDPVEHFREAWGKLEAARLRFAYRESWASLHERGQELLRAFVQEEYPKLGQVHAVERAFELSITNLDVPFVGVIDLVAELDGKRTVVDLKTASASYQDHEVELSDQLSAYQLAEPRAEQLALCVLVKTKAPRIEWCVSRRTGRQLNEFLAKAAIVGRHIQDGLFYKRPGKWCAWCDYLPMCAEGNAGAGEAKETSG